MSLRLIRDLEPPQHHSKDIRPSRWVLDLQLALDIARNGPERRFNVAQRCFLRRHLSKA